MPSLSKDPTAVGAVLTQSLADLGAVLETVPDAMVGVDRTGVIWFVNGQAEAMFGYDRGALVGRLIETLMPESFRRVHQLRREGYVTDPKVRKMGSASELIGRKKDGSEFPVDIALAHIGIGDDLLVIAAVRDMTARREAEEDRRQADRMSAVVECSADAIMSGTLDGVITSWNPAAERLFGYLGEEIIGEPGTLLSPPGRSAEAGTFMLSVSAGTPLENFESDLVRKNGTVFPASLTVSPISDKDGTVVGASAIVRDVTEQKQVAQHALRLAAAEDLVHNVMASASIGISLADMEGYFRVVNSALCDLSGYDEAWFLTHRVDDIIHQDDLENALGNRRRIVAGSKETPVAKLRLVRADGSRIWVRRVAVLIPGVDGQPDLLMVQVEDVTAEHEAQEALAYRAFHDPLTGLHNRAGILEILKVDLRTAKRRGTSVGTLFVDLDNLKVVNDSLGHAAGDKVLAAVANRIVAALRPGDRVGRFGGDEFVIVVQDVHDVQVVERCAQRVSSSIAADLQVHRHRVVPTASIGIAVSNSTSTPDSLLRDTDSALARAKAAGRARWQFFDDAMYAEAMARLTIEDQLRDAITRGEFVVHYQPIVALADAHVVGHEALARWKHPTRGLLSPGDFLDVAEATGLIRTIGAQVLDQACATLADRPDLPGTISVNVSAVQLASPDWLNEVRDAITRHRVDPARIVIEVTETAVLNLSDFARHALTSLRNLRVGIHVDDFGTGYSSIALLRDLPVTGVKLDLRFVHDLTTGDSQANALAHGLSGLVNGMHLAGIAEGIETEMQAGILLAQGWQFGQGYYFGRPAPKPVTARIQSPQTIT